MHTVSVLRASFEALRERLEFAAKQLREGECPSSLLSLSEELEALRRQQDEVRASLEEEARSLGMELPENLETLSGLEALHAAIARQRRAGFHHLVGERLRRILSLSHREEAVFESLAKIKKEAAKLLTDEADLEALSQLAEGEHPFFHLLQLLEDDGELTDEAALLHANEVESSFGRAVAVAVLRKRLLLGEPETPSAGSMELPAFFSREAGRGKPMPLSPERSSAPSMSPSQGDPSALRGSSSVATGLAESASSLADSSRSSPVLHEPKAVEDELAGEGGLPEGLSSMASEPNLDMPRTDTWDDLDSAPSSAPSSELVALAEASVPEKAQAPVVSEEEMAAVQAQLATSRSELTTPTDEVPILNEERIAQQLSFPPTVDSVEEPQGADALHADGDSPSVPSIEALAVVAMNEVLFPNEPKRAEEPARRDLGQPSGNGSSVSLPLPPSSPPKTPAPTFMTPLPLSVSPQPGRVRGKGKSRDMLEPAAFPAEQELGFPNPFAGLEPPKPPVGTGAELSSASLQLESYDAMYVRATDPKDPSRCSPLTVWQEMELQKEEHGVVVLFGSSALGLEDVSDFIELSVGAESLYVLDQVYAPHRFLKQIEQISSRRGGGNMTVVLVSQQTPWDSSWVRGALEQVTGMKSSSRPLRVVFIADPPSTWSMIPSIQPLERDGAVMMSLQPWHDSALLKWLETQNFPYEHKIRRSIRRVTGNWSFALKFFYRQMKQNPTQWARHLGSLKQVLESKELAQKALRIMGLTHKTTLSILHKLSQEEPATQESMERAFAHAPPRLITRALLWAERLSLVQYENYFWTTNPLVARLLKALR